MNWEFGSVQERVNLYDDEERRKFGNTLKRKDGNTDQTEMLEVPAFRANPQMMKVLNREYEPVQPLYPKQASLSSTGYANYFPQYEFLGKDKEFKVVVPPNLDLFIHVNGCLYPPAMKKYNMYLDSIPLYRSIPNAPLMLPGKAGEQLVVQTNTMLQRSDGKEQLYQYVVSFTPHVPSALLRHHLFYSAIAHGKPTKEECEYVYKGTQDSPCDMKTTKYCYMGGKKAFSIYERDTTEVYLKLKYENNYVRVMMEKRSDVASMQVCDLLVQNRIQTPPDVLIECISAIYRAHLLSKQPNVRKLLVTSHKLALQSDVLDLGKGLVIVPATVYRTRPSNTGQYAIVHDIVGTVVYKALNQLDIMQYYKFDEIFPHLTGLRVEHIHTKEVMTITGRSRRVCSEQALSKKGAGASETVAQRAQTKYNRKLQYLSLENPAIQCGSKKRMFPQEHQQLLPSQIYRGPLEPIQKHQYQSFQCVNPTVRTAITRFQEKPVLGKEVVVKGFEKGQIPGRVLPIPEVVMRSGGKHTDKECPVRKSKDDTIPLDVTSGAWGLGGGQAFRPVDVKIGLLMQVDTQDDILMGILDMIKVHLEELGCTQEISARKTYTDRDDLDYFFTKKFKKHFADVNMVFSTTPGGADYYYGFIKRACMLQGVCSQNMSMQNLARVSKQGLENVRKELITNQTSKQITKLGGEIYRVNSSLLQERPVMILGCDVDHPAMLSGLWAKNAHPSHSCIVGSWDQNGQCYSGVSQQQGVKEEIVPFGHMFYAVVRFLSIFKEQNHVLPEVIMYYRDGMSDHDLVAINKQELVAVRNAARLFGADYMPKQVSLVIVKRHPIRFTVPGVGENVVTTVHNTSSGIATGMDGQTHDLETTPSPFPAYHNSPIGFVVDHTLTRPQQNEFFLQSHISNHTARPMLYQVITNEAGYSMDEQQQLTLDLCFSGQRTPRASSIPAPLLHSHTMCRHTRKQFIDNMNNHLWKEVPDYEKFANKPFYM